MSRTSLYVDIGPNPRTTEGSNVVAKKWGATVDPYLAEIPDVESGNEQCRELYFNITAERLLFRKKLLGLPVDEDLVADANIAAAHPFGEANPTFGELAVPSVRLAAAFVPLTPDEKDVTHRPVMARLYCASGLSGRYASPFTEGLQDAGIQNYNWFVAGVKDDVLKMGISGRSWLLAANLLMRIVEQNDMATARNLINNFIVTGNVEDGAISRVTIGRKPELVNIKEFRNLKCIVPMNNANEMTAVPARRIEKLATLEDAYKLIETMQSKATRSFFRFLKNCDLDGMKLQFGMGADIFAEDEITGISPIEYISREIEECHKAIGAIPRVSDADHDAANWNRRIEKLRELKAKIALKTWLLANGADCAKGIYLVAKTGDDAMLSQILQHYPINAKDGDGLTATDWAIEGRDAESVRLLSGMGGRCDSLGVRNGQLKTILAGLNFKPCKISEADWTLLEAAMDAGFSNEAKVHFMDCYEDANHDIHESWHLQLNLPGLAIYNADERLMHLCATHGWDINKEFQIDYIDFPDAHPLGYRCYPEDIVEGKDFRVVKSEMMKPLKFAYMIGERAAVEMLKRYGAIETDDIISFVKAMESTEKAKRHKVYIQAINKLAGSEDSAKNHKLIIECLKHGESISETVQKVRLAVEVSDSNPCYVRAPLYCAAILCGWTKILQACIEIGFPVNDSVEMISDCDYDVEVPGECMVESVSYGGMVARVTPMQLAKLCAKEKRWEIIELLKKYGAR
ncbi:MAG: hypothetical protein IJG70_07825 [Kiritimatiellae bacterium]|nr:hypothetical protein [Kiritimatiellia bacterium]